MQIKPKVFEIDPYGHKQGVNLLMKVTITGSEGTLYLYAEVC